MDEEKLTLFLGALFVAIGAMRNGKDIVDAVANFLNARAEIAQADAAQKKLILDYMQDIQKGGASVQKLHEEVRELRQQLKELKESAADS